MKSHSELCHLPCHRPIRSMDLHPSREMVASGQRAGRSRKTQAHIHIWSTETLLTLYVFGMGELDAGVSAVAFSQLVRTLPLPSAGEELQWRNWSE